MTGEREVPTLRVVTAEKKTYNTLMPKKQYARFICFLGIGVL